MKLITTTTLRKCSEPHSTTYLRGERVFLLVLSYNRSGYQRADQITKPLSVYHRTSLVLEQGWATIFVRGPHCTFLGASRARFQSKRLL